MTYEPYKISLDKIFIFLKSNTIFAGNILLSSGLKLNFVLTSYKLKYPILLSK